MTTLKTDNTSTPDTVGNRYHVYRVGSAEHADEFVHPAEEAGAVTQLPNCTEFVKPNLEYCLRCGSHAVSHFPYQTDKETPEN
jgi:hypothetical protein